MPGRTVVDLVPGVALTDGEPIAAQFILVAAGLATAALVPGLEIVPKKGHLVITERMPGFIRHQVIELGYLKSAHAAETDSVAFNVQPRITGQILIGSSRQPGNAGPAVEYGIVGRMLRRAFEYMPALRRVATLRAWTGLRPATRDNLPLIGRHPELENVFVAAGHEGLGITTATGTAAIITDQILGRMPAIDASPFDPARIYRR
jgi:glycine/D-amino acid oxidase-like deaminating enzyme